MLIINVSMENVKKENIFANLIKLIKKIKYINYTNYYQCAIIISNGHTVNIYFRSMPLNEAEK